MRCALAGKVGRKGDAGRRKKRLAQLTGQIGGGLPGEARIPVQRIRRGKDDAHLVPGVGQRVAEGMHGAFRLRQIGRIGGEKHT
ncbi:hypothetical protein D3C72_1743520 [compost metagenome]